MIHSPSWFIKNGKGVSADFYRSVYAAHFNHVHAAMTNAGLDAAGAGGGGGGIGGVLGAVGSFVANAGSIFGSGLGKFAGWIDPAAAAVAFIWEKVDGKLHELGSKF